LDFVDSDVLTIRCEFSAGDDSETYLVSSAFTPHVSVVLFALYQISSPNTAVELTILTQFTEQVIQRHSLSQQRNYFIAFIPSTVEPIYVVLHAYAGVSMAASSISSVSITTAFLTPHNES